MLLAEPAVVGDIGFQLSLAATAGLLAWARPLADATRRFLPARTPALMVDGLAVSLAAQAATLPLVLFHFGRLSPVAPLANLLATPLVAPAMITAAAALAVSALVGLGLPPLLLAPFTLAGALGVGGLIGVAQLSASLPLASIGLPPPLDLVGALLATGLVALLLRRTARASPRPPPSASVERRRTDARTAPTSRYSRALAAGVAALAVVVFALGGAKPDGRLHVTVLDVGQGDAILLEGAAGGRILVDTGPDPDRLLGLLDARLPAWDRRIDLVVLSHPHEDHVAGLALLLDRYRIGGIAEPGMVGLGPGDAAYRRRLAELGRQTTILTAGDRIDLDGARIDVRWPLPGRVPLRPADGGQSVNNISTVLDVTFGERRLLLTGDVEEQIDPQLLGHGLAADGRPLDVLKVAHHGSATATTDAFVQRLQPSVAIISAGWGNPYGHPSPRTVERLEQAGAKLFRTDLDGSVEITTDGLDLRVEASGGRPLPTRTVAQTVPGVGFCPLPLPTGAAPAGS
ncbi:MAG: ComEC/Rec2 family competence protein, partial [Chloroflexota bacterium]|nr:ComEC/Rec2 family competence protein [Chloroflexota bacterium]